MKKTVTIKDIAEQLNLSRNTVSKAINGQYVPEKTRELVLNKARELNYKTSIIRYTPEKKKRYRILLLSGKPLNNIKYFLPIIRTIENFCYENHHELFQFTYNSNISNFEVVKEYITDLKLDGILAIETFDDNFISKVLGLNIPICFIDCSVNYRNFKNKFDMVEAENYNAIESITTKLIEKYDIKRFTFVGDITHCLSFKERYFGMISALYNAKIIHKSDEDILESDQFDYGNSDMLKILIRKLKHKPECVICGNDFIARTICRALSQLNIEVPKDCFVVGFDNVSDAVLTTPKITTFKTPSDLLGKLAIHDLLERISNPSRPNVIHIVDTSLVERESTIR